MVSATLSSIPQKVIVRRAASECKALKTPPDDICRIGYACLQGNSTCMIEWCACQAARCTSYSAVFCRRIPGTGGWRRLQGPRRLPRRQGWCAPRMLLDLSSASCLQATGAAACKQSAILYGSPIYLIAFKMPGLRAEMWWGLCGVSMPQDTSPHLSSGCPCGQQHVSGFWSKCCH